MSMTKGTPASSQIIWLEGRVSDLEHQRDELLAALETAHKLIDAVCPFEGDTMRKIEKAITKAKGGAV